MKPIYMLMGCVSLSVALAGPTRADDTAATGTSTVATTQAASTAPNGNLEKYHDKWRASKLVGANVYNESGQTIGSIDDLMVGTDGKISDAVLSVGGFLGIGGKLVSVPFDQFKFMESRRNTALNNGALAPVASPAPETAPVATAPAPARTTTTNNMDVVPASPIYFSIVLPNATKNSLSAAAGFKYTAS